MADSMPYMNVVKRVPDILGKITKAGTPSKFTHEFLRTHLGFRSSNDRGIIKVLKALGFLNESGVPTERYNDFKNDRISGQVLAHGLRDGWSDVFLADKEAYERSTSELTEIFKSVTGKSESVSAKMATTFNTLCDLATWSGDGYPAVSTEEESEKEEREQVPPRKELTGMMQGGGEIALHHDIHVHLPPTSDVAVYTAIFRALREELID